jgi:hypothetical protein
LRKRSASTETERQRADEKFAAELRELDPDDDEDYGGFSGPAASTTFVRPSVAWRFLRRERAHPQYEKAVRPPQVAARQVL